MDYNRDAPSILGIETPILSVLQYVLASPQTALAMEVVPGAVSVNEWHSFLLAVAGSPGLCLDIVNVLNPASTVTRYRAGSDSDQLITGWYNQAGGALSYTSLDDRTDGSAYGLNNSAMTESAPRNLASSGNNSGALAGRRILAVHNNVDLLMLATAGTAGAGAVRGILARDVVAGVPTAVYTGPEQPTRPTGRFTAYDRIASWPFNPATGLPWLIAGINDYLDPAANEVFGCQVRVQAALNTMLVNELSLDVEHCAENRMWYMVMNSQPQVGWHQQAMTSLLGALSGSTKYWLIISCPYASAGNNATVPVLLANTADTPLSASATAAGEHRRIQRITLGWPGGVPATAPGTGDALTQPAEEAGFFGVLLGNAGTIHSQSQALVGLDRIPQDWLAAASLVGQQITTPAGGPHSVSSVQLPLAWVGSSPPDAPLIVDIRSGVGAISGGGTLVGRCTIQPGDCPSPAQFVRKRIDAAPLSLASSTQYHLIFSSGASIPRGWALMRADSRSDKLQPTPTTTQNEVEKATVGPAASDGQADSYVAAGVANDRYDLVVALVVEAGVPQNMTATPVAAQTVEGTAKDVGSPSSIAPHVLVTWAAPAVPLGTAFRAWIIQRRRRTTPASPWVTIMDRRVDTAVETPADVERNDVYFRDYTAGWGVVGEDYAAGWDYAVMSEDNLGRRTSISSAIDLANVVSSPGCDSWAVSNRVPWLNARIRSLQSISGGGADQIDERPTLGGGSILRAAADPPSRRYSLSWSDLNGGSDRIVRVHRELALSGEIVAVLEDRGGRLLGMLTYAGYARAAKQGADLSAELALGGSDLSLQADAISVPCEVVLDGATGLTGVSSHANLNPGSSSFTLMVHGRIGGSGTSDYLVSKGQLGTGDGYAIRTTGVAGAIEGIVDGATAAKTCSFVDASLFGQLHTIWLQFDTDANLTSLYVDDETTSRADLAGDPGAVTNALALLMGGNNNGSDAGAAASFMACSWRSVAYWNTKVGSADRISTHRYLAGHYGYRAAVGPEIFFDAADERSWAAIRASMTNLSDSLVLHRMTMTGAWSRRGRPWPLEKLDRLL